LKKIATILILICMILSLNQAVKAEYKKVFAEYFKEEDYDDYGPKFGLDWGINDRWSLFLSHQLEGDGANEATTYGEVRYLMFKDLALILDYETTDSENSAGFKFNYNHPVNNSLWVNGILSYTANFPETGSDYNEVELYGGLNYRISQALLLMAGCNLSNTGYEENSVLDYQETEFSAGLEYQLSKRWRISGRGFLTDTNYDDDAMDELWGDYANKFVFGAVCWLGDCTVYLEYPFPQKGNTSKIGVSYSF